MNQTKLLYIFVASDIPDVYINTIGYCIEHFDLIRVVLLGITKDKGQKRSTEKYLRELKERITNQLLFLQEGRYLYKDQHSQQWKEREIDVQHHDRVRYAKLSSIDLVPHAIIYGDLEREIDEFLGSAHQNCIFDVSPILKGYLIDVFIVLLSKRIEDIYTFELRLRGRSYDEKELIHNLSLDNGDYEFVNLTKSDYTNDKVIKTKQEAAAAEKANGVLEKVIDTLSSDFATIVLAIYTFFVIGSFVVIVFLINRANWSEIEPWTFIFFGMPLFTYLISLVIQLIFQRELSFRPKNIFDWLKSRRKTGLAKKLGLEEVPR